VLHSRHDSKPSPDAPFPLDDDGHKTDETTRHGTGTSIAVRLEVH
jgi:hypothetical protein